MAAKPIVDGIERQYGERLTVIRLNIQEPVGQRMGERYDFAFTPTFILLDPEGEEQWRAVGALDPAEIRARVDQP